MACDGAVRGFGLEGFAVRGDEDGGHEAEGAEALGDDVGLDVAVVVFESHDVAARGLHHLGDHVVDESMFVPDFLLVKLRMVIRVVDFLEQVFEAPVVFLKDGVLGAHVQGKGFGESEFERGVREAANGVVGVVLSLGDPTAVFKFVDFDAFRLATGGGEDHFEGSRTLGNIVFGAILVSKSVSADDDGLLPPGHKSRYSGDDDRFSEDGTSQGVSYCAIGTEPHLLQVELFDSCLIGGNRRAFYADGVLLDRFSGINGDLVISFVAVGKTEVVVFEVYVEVRVNEFVFDLLPDYARHLIAIKLNHGVLDRNLLD